VYQWDYDMEIALQIAMNYRDRTGQTSPLTGDPLNVAIAIAEARKPGVHHRIKLANAAINSVERERNQQHNRGN
jgi:hypothetical protein